MPLVFIINSKKIKDMYKDLQSVPKAYNEQVKSYAPGTPERAALKVMLAEMKSKEVDVPMVIGGRRIKSENKVAIRPPHDHQHVLGYYYKSGPEHVTMAIEAALEASKTWKYMPWEQRAAIFLRAADLISPLPGKN